MDNPKTQVRKGSSMRIAVIGAGFCGVATCWYLLESFPNASVVLFDKEAIGSGASGAAAGLLHPFAGAHAKLNREGFEGMEATKQLLEVSKKALGQSCWTENGILRVAINDTQKKDYQQTAKTFPIQTKWLIERECQQLIREIQHPSLLIQSGMVINCPLYLQGLWKACEQKGAILQIEEVSNLQSLDDFDLMIITAGSSTAQFPELSPLRLFLVKGQLLEYRWDENLPDLVLPISSTIYMVMHPTKQSFFAGATYERQFKDARPDIDVAMKYIQPKVKEILPALIEAKVIGCQAGIRVSTPDHLPKYGAINERIWYLTGMGSKGLLYHGLYAQKLVECLITC